MIIIIPLLLDPIILDNTLPIPHIPKPQRVPLPINLHKLTIIQILLNQLTPNLLNWGYIVL